MPRAPPQGVYAIADSSAGRPLLDLVAEFVRGGAVVVQLRVKGGAAGLRAPGSGSGELLEVARAARRICTAGKTLLFINDRPDIARLCEADGLHLGQEDLPLAEARAIVGPQTIIGISTHSDAEIDAAQDADYIGFGPIFATQSKPGAILPPPHGIEGLRRAVQRSKIPVVAIGGITAATSPQVVAAGAHCIAAIAELCNAADPAAAVRSLAGAWSLEPGAPDPGAAHPQGPKPRVVHAGASK